MKAEALRRERQERARTIKLARTGSAVHAIGPISPGMDVYCLTFGQFDLSDAIVHICAGTGPADVVMATWTAAKADIKRAEQLLNSQLVRSMRWVVDRSFPNRQPVFYDMLRASFGSDAVVITKSHCKFVLITNAEYNIVIRTSMNLNTNQRLENIEVVDDPELAVFLLAVVDSIESEGDSIRPPILADIETDTPESAIQVGDSVRVGI